MGAWRGTVVGVVLGLASPAAAQAERPSLWERAADPHRERVDSLVSRARTELLAPASARDAAVRAEVLAREALKLDGRSFAATVALAEALARQGRGVDAARAFERGRGLAGTKGEAAWCALRVGIELSRAGRYEEALAAYDRHVALGEAQAAAHTNAAEILMALGNLREAQERYREAARLGEQAPASRERDDDLALALYGLAVALDRDDQPLAAREAMARALALDPKGALLLGGRDASSELFFVPPGDVHYYRGLVFMFLGRGGEAADAFQRFLTEQKGSRFVARAETHLLALAAGAAPVAPRLRAKVVATATLRAAGPLPAPLLDAAWRRLPNLVEPCAEHLPRGVAETVRLSLEVEIDGQGTLSRMEPAGGEAWRPFVACIQPRARAGLRLPSSPGAGPTTARVDLVLAVRP